MIELATGDGQPISPSTPNSLYGAVLALPWVLLRNSENMISGQPGSGFSVELL
ncbi:MAG: hypothetical protein ACYSYV_04285 [Planctomycetota bacterium]